MFKLFKFLHNQIQKNVFKLKISSSILTESFVEISSLIVDCGYMFLYFFNFALGIINAGLIAPSSAFLKYKINKN